MRRIGTTLFSLLVVGLFLTDTAVWAQTVTVITPTRTGIRSPLGVTAGPTPVAVPRLIPKHESKVEIFQRMVDINAPVGPGDAAVQNVPGTLNAPTILTGFEGLDINGFLPPDSDGGIGLNHYFEWINVQFAIFDRTGTMVFGPAAGNTMFTGLGGPCVTNNDGDPVVLYDQLADRWFVSQFAVTQSASSTPESLCIAVSDGSDPLTSSWFLYEYTFVPVLPDYMKYGIWDDMYTLTFHGFTGPTFGYTGFRLGAFDRTAMLAGNPTAQLQFYNADAALGGDFFGALPPRVQGPANVAPGTPAPFVHLASNEGFSGTDRYTVLELDVDFATPANTTLTRTDLAASPFNQNLCGFARNCIPQPGTAVGLDSFGGNTLFQAPVRDLDPSAGVDLRLVAQGPVDVNGADLSGIRWIELQNTGGGWSVRQQSTFAPADGRHRWMGSIAMNGNGDIAMGYSVSDGTSTFPAIWATGRLAGDPLNTMSQGETVLRAGVASQTHSSNRWGDYAVTNVDPTDDLTFWHVNEYITASGTWSTHIAHFQLTPPPPATDIHVESITTQTLNLGQGNKQGQALVEIRDDAGSIVAGAQVTGVFSGDFNETQTQTTNGSGIAQFLTAPKKGSASFSFCVSNVVGSLPYDPSDNTSPSFACSSTPPAAPTSLTASAVSSTQINLGWTDNANNETGFQVERSLDGVSFSQIASVGANVTSYSNTGLTPSTTYFYRMRAVNGIGNSAYSNTANATTQAGGTPTSVHVESVVTSTINEGGGNKRGRAIVTLNDNLGGNPGAGYQVDGQFSGTFSDVVSGTTGSGGTITFTTATTARGGVSVNFCVSNVSSGSLIYNSGDNSPGTTCSPSAAAKGALVSEVPIDFALEQNFPNPFNPTTIIAYSLAEAGPVTLKVYNVLGQEVATLVDGYIETGRHQVVFDASRLSAGVYLYVIRAEGFTATKRMTLLK